MGESGPWGEENACRDRIIVIVRLSVVGVLQPRVQPFESAQVGQSPQGDKFMQKKGKKLSCPWHWAPCSFLPGDDDSGVTSKRIFSNKLGAYQEGKMEPQLHRK